MYSSHETQLGQSTLSPVSSVRFRTPKCTIRTISFWRAVVLAAGLAMVTGGAPQADDDITSMIPLIPASANSVSVIRVREMIRSPRGVREGWNKTGDAKVLAGVEQLPINMPYVVRAAHIVPNDSSRGWFLTLFPWPADMPMSQLAKHERGEVDMINGTATVSTSRNGYFVHLRPTTLGVITPADRQDVARWIRFAKQASQPSISEYLRHAIDDTTSHIVLAFDVEDSFEKAAIREYIDASRSLSDRNIDTVALVDWIKGLKGVCLKVRIEEKTTADIEFEFATKVGNRADHFHRLLVEFLNDRGAAIDELSVASVNSDGNILRMSTTLSDESLRRVMTVLSSPPPSVPTVAGKILTTYENDAAAVPHTDRDATMRYYAGVMQLLDDLERTNVRAKNYLTTAVWHENYARKIDQLPVRGVDDELVAFGTSAVQHLRALAASLRGVPLRVNSLQRTITYDVQVAPYSLVYDYWLGYRFVGYPGLRYTSANLAYVREQQAEAIARGSEERNEVWNMLLSERSEIRHKMVTKYPEIVELPQKDKAR